MTALDIRDIRDGGHWLRFRQMWGAIGITEVTRCALLGLAFSDDEETRLDCAGMLARTIGGLSWKVKNP